MAAYSMDLRTRVVADWDAGIPAKELAARYHVSVPWVNCAQTAPAGDGDR